jgi:hypothetical protein
MMPIAWYRVAHACSGALKNGHFLANARQSKSSAGPS